MSKRFKNAYEIWNVGASNPVGVTNALLDAMKEVRDEGGDVGNDPAVQVILDHLCFLCGMTQPSMLTSRLDGAIKIVEERAKCNQR